MKKLDIARALKDKDYFNGLTAEQQSVVSAMNPAGISEIGDAELETVAGGLEGGYQILATTTTTAGSCSCNKTPTPTEPAPAAVPGGCACEC